VGGKEGGREGRKEGGRFEINGCEKEWKGRREGGREGGGEKGVNVQEVGHTEEEKEGGGWRKAKGKDKAGGEKEERR